jgi:hypothetical protein
MEEKEEANGLLSSEIYGAGAKYGGKTTLLVFFKYNLRWLVLTIVYNTSSIIVNLENTTFRKLNLFSSSGEG